MTPISQRKIKLYLHMNQTAAVKWYAFIQGDWNLTPQIINKMTAPQLSLLIWAMQKRYKTNLQTHGMLKGNSGKTISG